MRGLIILSVLLFSGCVSLKQTKQVGIKKVSKLSAFDGVYENTVAEKEASQFSTFWQQLKLSDDLDSLNLNMARIEITALSETRIRAILLQGNEKKKELIWSGKLKNNYFVSRNQRTMIPIPLIYGEFKNNQFQFALTEDNSLLVDRLENQWGWVFLFLANKDSTRSFEYKKFDK
ncbi:hypothetical protein [Pedobacter nyackensis]|uniref:hypothetical protein n=1 Tax=Pedobacter nyackensis TaxID=475255 RepID=UPI002931AB7E|nr:hypothetical protein [Pedobacter nyackensis]